MLPYIELTLIILPLWRSFIEPAINFDKSIVLVVFVDKGFCSTFASYIDK